MNSNSNKPMKHGTYHHYRRLPDGTEVYLGEVHYTYPSEETDTGHDAERALDLAWRDEEEIERRARDCEAFEALADASCDAE